MKNLKNDYIEYVMSLIQDAYNNKISSYNEYEEINTPEYCENNGVYDMIDADYKQELVNIYNNAISRGLTEEELVAIDDNFAYI